jgi:hypothetical protein
MDFVTEEVDPPLPTCVQFVEDPASSFLYSAPVLSFRRSDPIGALTATEVGSVVEEWISAPPFNENFFRSAFTTDPLKIVAGMATP